ncbi:tectonic-3 isoform X2 [Boleophthalmus pectinirostris]|uniref:tectonic-3 isoform X2 n=1 Tax=Boleophthalmus pectinirostris TaxID=150288 RepID=UPI00242DC1C2|nr:tectonic-3 isoform X2 [Boleophthalmus pectinirostris]
MGYPLFPCTAAPDTNVTTEEFTPENGTVPTTTTTVVSKITDAPAVPSLDAQVCLCNLTPDFCDIGCCCDTEDCGVANLSTVFTGCPQKAISGVCVEKWLIFRANVDSSLVTVTDSLFCVQPAEKSVSTTETAPNYPPLGDSYHFAPPDQIITTFTRDFYRVDDLILTYFPKTSARFVLRQPCPGPASALCTNRNPAKFLRSSSFSCSREVTSQSCMIDPTLNAQSYIYDLNLIKHPIFETDLVTGLLIPVIPSSKWNTPRKQNNSCVDVVKRVEFVIGYTERGEISSAKVNIVLANLTLKQLLLQTHTVQFQLIPQTPPVSTEPIPAVGLKSGSPVIGRYHVDVKPLTVIGVSQNGGCSDSNTRMPILFGHNSISGCSFTSMVNNCSDLRTQIYDIHRGVAIPDLVAMNSGSQPDWTRVLSEECLVASQEFGDTGCMLPHTLSIRVLWARQGLLELPQDYILGVKYMFHCSIFKCPLTTPIALSNEVTFVDTSLYPKPPQGAPQLQWRFPFGFFSRGVDEVDGHILSKSSGSLNITWIFIVFTIWFIKCLIS